jgi:hypothetical protein
MDRKLNTDKSKIQLSLSIKIYTSKYNMNNEEFESHGTYTNTERNINSIN